MSFHYVMTGHCCELISWHPCVMLRRRLTLTEQTAHQGAGGGQRQRQGRANSSSSVYRAQLLVGQWTMTRVQQRVKQVLQRQGVLAELRGEQGAGEQRQGRRRRVRQM
jgi:hypothetical protein